MASSPLPTDGLSDSLALAMVAISNAPLLLLDDKLTVVAASNSFCDGFRLNPLEVGGREIFSLGHGEWDVPQLRSLFKATALGRADVDAYEMDLKPLGWNVRRLVISAQALKYGDHSPRRLLVTISDVTDARLAERLREDLVREKAILLQEVQHRVANSLQIIASVLLQTARKVQSEETRVHLRDAHNRVMSIATVQKQLAMSQVGDVELCPYFTQLCESLGASMIRDHMQQSIEVTADGSRVTADVSVSLGLIVTELVINALKHAFPDGRPGKIKVGYHSMAGDWTLCVEDNGVGIMPGPTDAKPGLGTSLVEALSRQLQAHVEVIGANPGTRVEIIHKRSEGNHGAVAV
jgi:two-component sensor histidine kinase